MASSNKYKHFRKADDGKFVCLICNKSRSSKQRILSHLQILHEMTPVKREKKLYLQDESASVPMSTLYRWKRQKNNEGMAKRSLAYCQQLDYSAEGNSTEKQTAFSDLQASKSVAPETFQHDLSLNLLDESQNMFIEGSPSCLSFDENLKSDDSTDSDSMDQNEFVDDCSEGDDVSIDSIDSSDSIDQDPSNSSHYSDDETDSENLMEKENDCEDFVSSEYSSADDGTDLSTYSEDSESSDSSCLFQDDNVLSDINDSNTILSESERQALKILCCFQKNHLSKSACKDILETMKSTFPNSEHTHVLDYNFLQTFVDKQDLKEIHYCEFCCSIFPNDLTVIRCNTENCTGFRYKGSLSQQQGRNQKPRRSFVIADTRKQLSHLLQSPGILQEIENCKGAFNYSDDSNTLKDITDGSIYRSMLESENGFLKNPYNLTGIINTDGVNLYSSTKVELWPVFLALNELRPKVRFSRENMLLIGIWQGKGKPPFKQFFESLSEELNSLYNDGVQIEVENKLIVSRLAVICGVFDLPAKACVLNMTYYNGSQACITCEEPGITTKQGKGTARCYPYRNVDDRYPLRHSEQLIEPMQNATDKNRIKGFRGISCLASLQSYDLVKGTVPDYMHGILLGISNMLLSKWFSTTQSNKPYFIGKQIKNVGKRLINIKPPACIERLPRDFEKYYQNLKATELQAWLLFYSLPCLSGILPQAYLRHVACLSEAIYILLGDNISQAMLTRASALLEQFYADFEELYGLGSCGLNVHNACFHLVWYVKLLGPLWAWSCFPFEDANAMLLKSVHGTGVVMKQIMQINATHSNLRKRGISLSNNRLWKVTHRTNNCDISGQFKPITNNEADDEFLTLLGVNSTSDLKKIDRISIDGRQFCSFAYTRMQKRVSYIVLYASDKVGSIQYFVYNKLTNLVYAVIKKYDIHCDTEIEDMNAGKHLISVRATDALDIVSAEMLTDTLINIDCLSAAESYVALMPNVHGHAIFK